MIVYNITTKVEWSILDNWIAWQLQEHIPETMATGLFDEYKMYRLLEQDDTDGPTFTIQYFASSLERYQQYMDEFAQLLEQKAVAKWSNKFVSFQTIMKVVN